MTTAREVVLDFSQPFPNMAKIHLHSDPPTEPNEIPFCDMLQVLEFPADNQPHVWFVKIPGMKDVDAIMWLRKTGLFVVELKAWELSCVRTISPKLFEVEPWCRHSTKKSPWEQVLLESDQFANKLARDRRANEALGKPWISPVVALFNIRRDDFDGRFQGGHGTQTEADYKGLLSQSTIFREDMKTGEALLQRLARCRSFPVYRDAPKFGPPIVPVKQAVDALDNVVAPVLVSINPLSAYDKERIKQIEAKGDERLTLVNWDKPVVCAGYVGTGKTFFGLRAAIRRLWPIDDVRKPAGLFVCHNKVLASDIRRLVDLSPRLSHITLDVYDSFDLIRYLANRAQLDWHFAAPEADQWAESLLEEILASDDPELATLLDCWGLIVVDEAQDLPEWTWRLLNRLSEKPGNCLFVIDGKDQLLYREAKAPFLEQLVREATKGLVANYNFLERRRVFRTTDTTFLISQLFAMAFPSVKEASRVWRDQLEPQYRKARDAKKNDAKADGQMALPGFELPRVGGRSPRLVSLERMPQDEIAKKVVELVRTGYEQTKKYFEEDRPSNVLILVPYVGAPPKSDPDPYDWAEIARQACETLGLRYIDYTDAKLRRSAYSGDEVRISTYHSSRGIEGLHSIVLGWNSLAEAAGVVDWKVRHLGYIALSRSVYDTDVVYIENGLAQREEVRFLQAAMQIVGN